MGKGPASVACPCGTGSERWHGGWAALQTGASMVPRGREAGSPIPQSLPRAADSPHDMPWVPLEKGGGGLSLGRMAPGQLAACAYGSFAQDEGWLVGAAGTGCHPIVCVPVPARQRHGAQAGVLLLPQANMGLAGAPRQGQGRGHAAGCAVLPRASQRRVIYGRGKRAAQTDRAIKLGQEVARLQRLRGAVAATIAGPASTTAAAPIPQHP